MFHAISKILLFLSTPIFWIFMCLALGIFLKKKELAKKFLFSSLALLFLFSNAFLQDEIIRLWEPPMSNINLSKKYDLAIVLGGFSANAPKAQQLNLYESGDRIWHGLELYQMGQVKKLLLSGGQGQLLDQSMGEAAYTRPHLINMGVKKKDLYIEPHSKNTRQNALESKRIIDSLGIAPPYLLITSAGHMPRSLACFKKIGLEVEPFCVDGMVGERKFYLDHLFLPRTDVLFRWNVVIHEWIGIVVYKVVGYA